MRPFSRSLAAVVASVLAACNAQSGLTAGSAEPERDIAGLAIDALAADLQIAKDVILVDTIQALDWPDSSIGCPKPGMAYMQVITPGHKVTLRANGQTYVVHEAGNKAFVCRKTKVIGGITPQRELVFGEQFVVARKDLASRIGVPESEIRMASAEEYTWDDGSLGCPEPGVAYAPGPVTGWILKLKHGMRDYTYHTDLGRTIPCPGITSD